MPAPLPSRPGTPLHSGLAASPASPASPALSGAPSAGAALPLRVNCTEPPGRHVTLGCAKSPSTASFSVLFASMSRSAAWTGATVQVVDVLTAVHGVLEPRTYLQLGL